MKRFNLRYCVVKKEGEDNDQCYSKLILFFIATKVELIAAMKLSEITIMFTAPPIFLIFHQNTPCLAEGGVDDVDAPLHPEELLCASPRGPEEAGGVTLVDEHEGVVLVGEPLDVGERADVAVHGEHAVSDNQTAPAVLARKILCKK